MADITLGPDAIETTADLDPGEQGPWDYWMGEGELAEKAQGDWIKRGRKIVRRYRDERTQAEAKVHRYNVLWSNVQTLKPTLYARTPKADVQRRFRDQDDTGRLASTLLERALSFSLDSVQGGDFDEVMAAVVEDRLLAGRGTARVVYVPHYGDTIEEGERTVGAGSGASFEATQSSASLIDNPGDGGAALREVVYEETQVRYVFWEDYLEGPARTWREVPWVRYSACLTRAQLTARFGKKKGGRVNLDFSPEPDRKEGPPRNLFKKAVVHEYWDRDGKRVIWLAPGTPGVILDEVDDPLGLPGFFPSPNPLLATTTNDKRVPVPDYAEYQDQADELDVLTQRIDRLTRALKVSGIYPGAEKQVLQQLVDEGTENRLIPVEDWAAFMDKGGLQNMIQWVPIQQVAQTLIQLYDARDRVKSILYEITGIGDIMRGETQPTETATAQRLKSNFVTRRIVPQQRDVARFARDLIRLMAAVISGHFAAQTIAEITGFPQLAPVPQLPPPPQQWVPAQPQMAGPQMAQGVGA